MARYEEERSGGGGSAGKITLLIFGIVGGVLIILGLICAGVAWMVYRTAQGVNQSMASMKQTFDDINNVMMVSEQFISNLQNGQTDAAYALTSDSFKKRQSLEEFRAFVDKNPALRGHTSHHLTFLNSTSTGGMCQAQLYTGAGAPPIPPPNPPGKVGPGKMPPPPTPGNPATSCTLTIVKDGQQWKIDNATVP